MLQAIQEDKPWAETNHGGTQTMTVNTKKTQQTRYMYGTYKINEKLDDLCTKTGKVFHEDKWINQILFTYLNYSIVQILTELHYDTILEA